MVLRIVLLLGAILWFTLAVTVVLGHELSPVIAFCACIVAGAGNLALHGWLAEKD